MFLFATGYHRRCIFSFFFKYSSTFTQHWIRIFYPSFIALYSVRYSLQQTIVSGSLQSNMHISYLNEMIRDTRSDWSASKQRIISNMPNVQCLLLNCDHRKYSFRRIKNISYFFQKPPPVFFPTNRTLYIHKYTRLRWLGTHTFITV